MAIQARKVQAKQEEKPHEASQRENAISHSKGKQGKGAGSLRELQPKLASGKLIREDYELASYLKRPIALKHDRAQRQRGS